MQKYDNGKASIEEIGNSIIAEKKYVFPSKRSDLEAAFMHTLDDCLRMKRALEKIIKASDYTSTGDNCKLLAEQALKDT